MSEFQRMKLPEKRISLADMARAAAKRNSALPQGTGTEDSVAFGGGFGRPAAIPQQPSYSALPVNRPSASGAHALQGFASGDDSGFIDLSMLRPMLSGPPAAAATPAPPAMAPQRQPATLGLDTLKPASVSVPPPPPAPDAGGRAAALAAHALSSKFEAMDDVPFARRRRGGAGRWAGALLVVAGIAGAYFLGMRAHAPSTDSSASVASPPHPAMANDPSAPAAQATDPTPTKAEAVPGQAAAPAEPPAAAAPSPPQQQAAHAAAPAAHAGPGAGARSTVAAAHEQPNRGAVKAAQAKAPAEPKPAPEPKAAPEPKQAPEAKQAIAAAVAESKPAPGGDPLAGAIRNAVGPIEKAKPEAVAQQAGPVSANSDVPEQPGKGAISGALSGPRGVAKTCLEGHTTPASVSVVFGSDGKVQTVNVNGAGTEAECVKRAFSRANVGAFRRATFPVSVTVTPP